MKTDPQTLTQILSKSSVEAAPLLLGWRVCRQLPEGIVKLKIVETEAYHQDDPASHSFRGVTTRTAPMFEAGGRLYIYFTYGMHFCLNIVTGVKGRGEGVLIRAGEPLEGIEIMKKLRGVDSIHKLANGPGKLTQALGIASTKLSGKILGIPSIFLESPEGILDANEVIAAPRIGITRAIDMPWRFYIKNSPYVSKIVAPPPGQAIDTVNNM